MEEIKQNQIGILFKCAEDVNNIFSIAYRIAVNSNYPAKNEIMQSAQELNRQIFLLTNYLYNPDAQKFVDAVNEQMNKINSVNPKNNANNEND